MLSVVGALYLFCRINCIFYWALRQWDNHYETTTLCTSRVRVEPPQIEERATAPLRPCVEAGVILHALPPGFDERSQEMYRQLLMLRESAVAQREPAPLAQPAH